MNFLIRILIYLTVYVGLFSTAFFLLGFLERKKAANLKSRSYFVSVIVPAYNEEDSLEKTVESVVNLDYPKDKLEILIVNDGSKDNTHKIGKMLERKYKNVKIYSKENGGKASALNYGLKFAEGELVVTFDADSIVAPDALNNMIPYFSDNKVMAVTPGMKVYKPRGIIQRIQAVEYNLGIFLRKAMSMFNGINVTPGPFSIYRKEFFDRHGGYDERSITEDMEMAMRIQSLNYKIQNSASSLVYTIAPRKFYDLLKQRRRWYLGAIKTFIQYREVFSRKYGEFGAIGLPLALFSVFSSIILTSYYVIQAIRDSINQINLYSIINFDILNTLSFKSYVYILKFYEYFSNGLGFFAIILMFFTISMLFFLNRALKSEEGAISTFISYGLFIFLYGLLYSIWWAVAIMHYIMGRRIKW